MLGIKEGTILGALGLWEILGVKEGTKVGLWEILGIKEGITLGF